MSSAPKPKSDKTYPALRRILMITLVAMPLALVLLIIGLAIQVDRGNPVSLGQVALVVLGIAYMMLAGRWLRKERTDRAGYQSQPRPRRDD